MPHCNLSANKVEGGVPISLTWFLGFLLHPPQNLRWGNKQEICEYHPFVWQDMVRTRKGGPSSGAKKRYMTNKFLGKSTPFRPEPGPLASKDELAKQARCVGTHASGRLR